jgi:redox-sensitive bicupin YhaK (pirin superfamily)
MTTTIITEKEQAKGQFNFGEIRENKPIGFPQDGGKVKPYSNLFYWAHAWTPGGESVIGEHPHQGFEIMSFVLKGSLEHYDSKHQGWRKLKEGDAQIIRSGNGITHAEKVNANSEFFQIWVDPDLDKTLNKPASYDDYQSKSFPVEEKNGFTIKHYHGSNAPMQMDTPGVLIKEIWLNEGEHELNVKKEEVNSIYLIEGEIKVNENEMHAKDFAIVENGEKISIVSRSNSRLFMLQTPATINYLTYAQRMRRHFA